MYCRCILCILARDVIYTSRAYATMSVSVCLSVCPSVCDGSALWSRCMPGRGAGSSRAMLATARLSCLLFPTIFMVNKDYHITRCSRSHIPSSEMTRLRTRSCLLATRMTTLWRLAGRRSCRQDSSPADRTGRRRRTAGR